MVLPVLQSLLTLGLLVAAVGFMAKRLWHIGVLINTGTRGDEILTDKPGERARTMLAYTLGQKRLKEDAAAGLLHLINSGPATLDGTGQQERDGQPAMKPCSIMIRQ